MVLNEPRTLDPSFEESLGQECWVEGFPNIRKEEECTGVGDQAFNPQKLSGKVPVMFSSLCVRQDLMLEGPKKFNQRWPQKSYLIYITNQTYETKQKPETFSSPGKKKKKVRTEATMIVTGHRLTPKLELVYSSTTL